MKAPKPHAVFVSKVSSGPEDNLSSGRTAGRLGGFPAGQCDDKLSLSGQCLVALLPCQHQAGFSAQIIFRVNAVSLVCFA